MKNYKDRSKARKYILQALYGWEFTKNPIAEIEAHFLTERNTENFDLIYFKKLIHAIPPMVSMLDADFEGYLTQDISSLDHIELCILRIAAYELKYSLDIPCKVVLKEAINLATMFGGENSYKFVNGVLDKLALKARKSEMQSEPAA